MPVSIGLRASPRQRRRLQYTVNASWSVGPQSKIVAIPLDQPHLPLPEPVREEAHRHFVGQGLLALVDKKATGISDIGASRSDVFLRSSAEDIMLLINTNETVARSCRWG